MRSLLTLLRPEWKHVAAAICAAGILHVCVTLASPVLIISPAYAKLAAKLDLHKLVVLPEQSPKRQTLPYMGPEWRYAACRFETKSGHVFVTAKLPSPGWALSIFTPEGDNIYSAVAPPGRTLDVSVKVVPSEDRFVGLSLDRKKTSAGTGRALTIAATEGLVLIRAPDQGTPYARRNTAILKRAACKHRVSS